MYGTGQTCPICRERIGDGHGCAGHIENSTTIGDMGGPGIDTRAIHRGPLLREIESLQVQLDTMR